MKIFYAQYSRFTEGILNVLLCMLFIANEGIQMIVGAIFPNYCTSADNQ